MAVLKFFGKILTSIITSTLISIILFIALYSFLTKEFPPNFSKMKKSYDSLTKMTKLSQSFLADNKDLSDDSGIEKLSQLMKKRVQLGSEIMIESNPQASDISTSADIKELTKELNQLKIKVNILENRIEELKSSR